MLMAHWVFFVNPNDVSLTELHCWGTPILNSSGVRIDYVNFWNYSLWIWVSMAQAQGEFAMQLVVHSGCWLTNSWLQRLGICRYRATDHIWSFCILGKARPTTLKCYLFSSFLPLVWHSRFKDLSKVGYVKGNCRFPRRCAAKSCNKGLQQHHRAHSDLLISAA